VANSLLEISTILPPLLERQISPPYRIVARHLDYLRKGRQYLLSVCTYDSDEDVESTNIQQSVDELISTTLLMDYVGRSRTTGETRISSRPPSAPGVFGTAGLSWTHSCRSKPKSEGNNMLRYFQKRLFAPFGCPM